MIDYDPHDWTSHLFDIRGSTIREIASRVLLCAIWSWIVVVTFRTTTANLESRPVSPIPATIHGLVGVALGLLLVFRTNSSYDRFWEGRKLWGGIVNQSRNLARQAQAHLVSDVEGCKEFVRWIIAFSYASMCQLRSGPGIGPMASRLPNREANEIVRSPHPPLAIARRLTSTLVSRKNLGEISDVVLGQMDQNIQLLVDYIGACERIHKTPLPYAYVVHLRRSLAIYCLTLPLAIVSEFGWWTIVATTMVAFIFLGIEEIGVEIEDPFEGEDNDLPLEKICLTIDRDLSSLIGDLIPVDTSSGKEA